MLAFYIFNTVPTLISNVLTLASLLIPKSTDIALIVFPCDTTRILPEFGKLSMKGLTLILTSLRLSPFGGLVSQPRLAA